MRAVLRARGIPVRLWYNRKAFPNVSESPRTPESTNVADFSPFAGVRYRGASAAARDTRRSTLRRDRRRPARDARGDGRAQLGAPHPPPRRDDRGRPLRTGRRHLPGVARHRRLVPRRLAPVLRVPHGVHRPARRPPPHPGRDRRPHPSRTRRRRRPAARADPAQGEIRPARAPAGDAGQCRPDLGPDPRHRSHRVARTGDTDRAVPRSRRRVPRDRRHRQPQDGRRDPEGRRARAAGARRRPSPVRDRDQLPQRARARPATSPAAPTRS